MKTLDQPAAGADILSFDDFRALKNAEGEALAEAFNSMVRHVRKTDPQDFMAELVEHGYGEADIDNVLRFLEKTAREMVAKEREASS